MKKLRGGKSQTLEGGIRMPTVMRFPGVIPETGLRIRAPGSFVCVAGVILFSVRPVSPPPLVFLPKKKIFDPLLIPRLPRRARQSITRP